jgi:acetate CoA/acetoacetate CoA-transferase alpha subunit
MRRAGEVRGVAQDKVIALDAAAGRVQTGMTLALGGFLGQGVPLTLIRALKERGVRDLDVYSNDGGFGDDGVVELVLAGMVRTLHCCHIGYTPAVGRAVEAGILELEWVPQGNLIEMLRCGGAGLGGFLTPVGVGTAVEAGHRVETVDGVRYLWERAVRADVAFVRAHVGDTYGNLCFRGTSRNYNTVVATCAGYVVAEVEHVYNVGELDPEKVHTPGAFVDAVVRSDVTYCGAPR